MVAISLLVGGIGVTGTAADVRPGDTIILTGAKQPDGSTQASTVALNPGGGGFRGGGGGGGGTRTTG